LGAALGTLALWLAFRGVDVSALWVTLRAVNYLWVGAALLSVIATTLVVTARWRLLFYPDHHERGWLALLGGILVGQMLNLLIPARLGDVARVYLVGTDQELSKTRVAATVVVEKVADLVVYTVGAAYLLAVVAVPTWMRESSLSLLITSLLGVSVIAVLSRWGRPLLAGLEGRSPQLPGRWLQRFWHLGHLGLDGLAALRSWRAILAVWGLSLLSWLLAATTNYLLFLAFGLSLPFTAAAFLLVVLQVGVAPPSLPGKLGVFHYLTLLSLSVFGVTRNTALSYALLLYVVAVLSKILAGGAWLAWLRWLPGSRQANRVNSAGTG
jgi:uncharacterized membrane protein YbhN (UPF0104 family)